MRAFRALYVENGIRDITHLIRARESGATLTGVGSGNLALVDDAIVLLVTSNRDHRGHPVSPAPHPGQHDTFRRTW